MIKISNIKLPVNYSNEDVTAYVSKILHIRSEHIKKITIARKSVDARKKNDISINLSVNVAVTVDEKRLISRINNKDITVSVPYIYSLPVHKSLKKRPVVIGAGPCGLFAALILAEAGERPILIERGKSVADRMVDVDSFWSGNKLNVDSNVQFGEGGAGTFSDGKLNTGTKNSRAKKVLLEMVTAGAPEDILYSSKPHIGTDNLPVTVMNIRKKIISLGGTVKFETKLTGLKISNDKICGAYLERGNCTEYIETDNLVLAIGHSARDTFAILRDSKVAMEAKPFSVGARIEHRREMIDKAQYGKFSSSPNLGAADYKLSVHLKNGRGVYTFCMCPGGCVVAAASERFRVVTNGMSRYARNDENSNSALLVGITLDDYGSTDVLAGVEFQRRLEEKAFIAGGANYFAPVQRVEDFLNNRPTVKLGDVKPSYLPGVAESDLNKCLPHIITDSMREGIVLMNNKLAGFSYGDALLTGVETRSSSPVRIIRNEGLESVSVSGIYPCGEGAGYAGGIVSAAVDGIRAAEAILIKTNI